MIQLAKLSSDSAESIFLRVTKRDVKLAESLERAAFNKLCLVADHYDCYGYRLEKKEEAEQSSDKRERADNSKSGVTDNRPSKAIRVEDSEKKGI